jgi:hypothetical protein
MQVYISGADPGFKVRGARLKKIAPSGGRRENVCGISCEKSRFYAKKSYFFQLRREARKYVGYFVWEITILRPKILFFPILGGGIYTVNADKSKEEIFDNRRSMLCSLELIVLMLVILIDTICVVFGLWKFSTDGSHSDRYKLCFFCLIYTYMYIHKRWFPYRRQSGSWRKEEISLSNTDDVIF